MGGLNGSVEGSCGESVGCRSEWKDGSKTVETYYMIPRRNDGLLITTLTVFGYDSCCQDIIHSFVAAEGMDTTILLGIESCIR